MWFSPTHYLLVIHFYNWLRLEVIHMYSDSIFFALVEVQLEQQTIPSEVTNFFTCLLDQFCIIHRTVNTINVGAGYIKCV